MNGSLSFETDGSGEFIRVHGEGLWSPERTGDHFRRLDSALRAMRKARGRACVLVDLSQASVQTAETAKVLNDWTARIYRAQDQVAVICTTALLAMQIRRQAQVNSLIVVADEATGKAWLAERVGDCLPGAATR